MVVRAAVAFVVGMGTLGWAALAQAAQTGADLSVDIQPDGLFVTEVGAPVELTVTIANAGPEEPLEPSVLLSFIRGVDPISLPAGCQPLGNGRHLCPLGPIPAAGEVALTFEVVLPEPAPGLEVAARVSDWSDDPARPVDPVPDNDQDSVEIASPTTSDMAVTADPIDTEARLGETLDIAITISNAGPEEFDGSLVVSFNHNLPFDQLPYSGCDKHPSENEFACRLEAFAVNTPTTGTMTIDFAEVGLEPGTEITWRAVFAHEVPYSELPEDRQDNVVEGRITLLPPAPPGGGGGELPRTGMGIGAMAAAGAVAVMLGAGLMLIGRRWRRSPAS